MRDHALELGAVELVEKAARHGNGWVLGIAPGRKRVRRRVLDHVDLRRGDPQAERERFHDVAELRLLARPELAGLALREDQLVAGEVRHERAADRYRERERQCRDAPARREILADEI